MKSSLFSFTLRQVHAMLAQQGATVHLKPAQFRDLMEFAPPTQERIKCGIEQFVTPHCAGVTFTLDDPRSKKEPRA